MSEAEILDLLKNQPFLDGLSEEHLKQMATCATYHEYDAGQMIFDEDGVADAAYLIIDGSVALEVEIATRGHHIVQTIHSGEVLGWSWLFPPYRWSFGALAIDPTRVIRCEAEKLREMQDTDCALGYDLMKRFAYVMMSRLSATRLQLVDFYGHSD
jgi:CRP/FNR family cyclic AMP-dependent transcriptional regulator